MGDTGERRIGGYRFLRIVGEGGMGVVHLAEAPDGCEVAVKVLRPQVVGDQEGRERLAREVGSLQRVSSPHVAEVIDADPWGEVPYVVTRYVDGPPLHDYVKQHGPLDADELSWFALGLAEALADVHAAGVLHRDVKPANVLIEGGSPVLIDFGLARLADDPRLTATGWLLGTPGYLAPEVVEGEEPTTASDVHAFAATVVFAATGRSPAGRGPSVAILDRVRRGEFDLDGVPPVLLPLITDCLATDPRRRPRLPQVIAALERTAERPDVQPTRLIPQQRDLDRPVPALDEDDESEPDSFARPPVRRGRQRLALGGLALCAAAGLAFAPYVAAFVLGLLTLVFRFGSVTAERHTMRQRMRGRPRWYDVPASALSSPAYLLVSLAGTLVLWVWAAATGAALGFVAFALGASVRGGLGVAAVVAVAGLWLGPGSARVRAASWRLSRPLARDGSRAPLIALVALGLAVLMVALQVTQGISWAPATGAPWPAGGPQDLRNWLP